MAKYKYKTQKKIQKIVNGDDTIDIKIAKIVAYIQDISRYSKRNRIFATRFFLEWILSQNVRDIYVAEML